MSQAEFKEIHQELKKLLKINRINDQDIAKEMIKLENISDDHQYYKQNLQSNKTAVFRFLNGENEPKVETAKKVLKAIRIIFKDRKLDKKEFENIVLNIFDIEKLIESDHPINSSENQDNQEIDALVEEVRVKIKDSIIERCSKMRVLDMVQPIELSEIYIEFNILEQISRLKHKDIEELSKYFKLEEKDFDRFSLRKIEKTITGIKVLVKNSKVLILGKPGSEKTTFLKRLAIQCIEQNQTAIDINPVLQDIIPIFITLKEFNKTKDKQDLLKFIFSILSKHEITKEQILKLLKNGRLLLLLDGLDEIQEQNTYKLVQEIEDFCLQHNKNIFVITCRTAAQEYIFNNFKEVEIANFNKEQIKEFSNKWWIKDSKKADVFFNVLEDNKHIKKLTTNPLLLTLVCLIFDDLGDFPSNRSELYKESINLLLKKWDKQRFVERDIYKNLSLKGKEDLLSKIAFVTFEKGKYFFKMKEVEKCVNNYFCTQANINTNNEVSNLDIEDILEAIEAQHGLIIERAKGIYSFSHLTFHEYFTSQYILQHPESITKIVSEHLTDRRWREVVFLTIGLIPKPEILVNKLYLVAQQYIQTENLQNLISWIDEKTFELEEISNPKSLPLAIKRIAALAFILTFSHNYKRHVFFNVTKTEEFMTISGTLSLALKVIKVYKKEGYDFNDDYLSKLNLGFELKYDPELEFISSLYLKVEAFKIFNHVKFGSILEDLQNFVNETKNNQALQEKEENYKNEYICEYVKKTTLIFLELEIDLINLSEEEVKALENYLYINELIQSCKQASSSDELTKHINGFGNYLLRNNQCSRERSEIRTKMEIVSENV